MKRFLIIPLLLLALTACSGLKTAPNLTNPAIPTTPAVASAQDAAQKSLYAIGTALQAAPGIMDALYNAGKLSKFDYNNAVPIINRAQASFKVAVAALKAAQAAGQDPTSVPAYTSALTGFLLDKANVDNLLTTFEQKPVGVTL